VQRILLQLYREANAKPSPPLGNKEMDDEENDFGYGFYGTVDDALTELTKSSRRSARKHVGTRIQLQDY
jgi:hypothetical protein